MDWRALKCSKDFLHPAYQCTNAASGQRYATLGMQPLIYSHLKMLCETTIAGTTTATGFTTPAVKSAAEAMLLKLETYEQHMNSGTAQIALFLDPRRSSMEASDGVKANVHDILKSQYGYIPEENRATSIATFNLFIATSNAQDVGCNEIDDFCALTAKADMSCKCPVTWWKQQSARFPTLSLLARDVLMIMGSSVPSESAFSDSGDMVRADRCLLSDENICMMMKLRSWNRLFGKFVE